LGSLGPLRKLYTINCLERLNRAILIEIDEQWQTGRNNLLHYPNLTLSVSKVYNKKVTVRPWWKGREM